MALSVLFSAWAVGALGGLHCVTMCGGFMAATAARDAGVHPLLPARALLAHQVLYHVGRIATYVALGAAFGAAGGLALEATALLPLQRALYLAANAMLMTLGLTLAFGTPGVAVLQRAGAAAFGVVLPIVRPLLQRPGAGGKVALGLVWGMVPCALVYSVLPLALFAGGAWQGGAVLLAFGLGTLPNVLAAGVLFARARHALQGYALRRVAAAILIAFALAGIWRVLYDPAALARGPFCLVP